MLEPVLHRLERLGHVEARWQTADTGRIRTYYRITSQGLTQLAEVQYRVEVGVERGVIHEHVEAAVQHFEAVGHGVGVRVGAVRVGAVHVRLGAVEDAIIVGIVVVRVGDGDHRPLVRLVVASITGALAVDHQHGDLAPGARTLLLRARGGGQSDHREGPTEDERGGQQAMGTTFRRHDGRTLPPGVLRRGYAGVPRPTAVRTSPCAATMPV